MMVLSIACKRTILKERKNFSLHHIRFFKLEDTIDIACIHIIKNLIYYNKSCVINFLCNTFAIFFFK